MNFTKSWISPDVADNHSLFTSCSSHVLQPCTFLMGWSYFWLAMWLSSCQCLTFNGSWVASILPGPWEELLMVTLLLQQLLVFSDVVSLHLGNPVTGDLCLWPQTHVGNRRSPPSCGTPTTSLHLGLLQFLPNSLTILFGRALFYIDDRNWNYIQMGINSWCFITTPISASWGNLSNLGLFHTFFFFTNVDFEVPSFSCLWPDFSQKLF